MKAKKAVKFIKDYAYQGGGYSFEEAFKDIILRQVGNYEEPKGFFEDFQHGGCISGMISEFIYTSDLKEFYIEHLDDLEEFKTELEESLGDPIPNRHKLPHPTFVVWLVFEEYCYQLYNDIYEN
jgi:hypothetical protein